MRKVAALLASLAACTTLRLPRLAEGAPVIVIGGAVKGGPFSLGRADLERLPRRSVHGVDPASGREAVWEGVSVAELVSRRVELEKGADVAVARTADRAAIAIPLALIRQLEPVLADRADGVRLATTILAWPTLEQRGLETDPRAGLWWARDVTAFDLQDWQKKYGAALATPDGAPDAARRGSAWYGERCISCHRVRGVGGYRGRELTAVAARLPEAQFAASIRRHPGWTGGDPPGAEDARDLWSFLHAVGAATVPRRSESAAP